MTHRGHNAPAVSASQEIVSRLRSSEGARAYGAYRQGILGMVSDAEILTRAGEGDMRNLRAMLDTRGARFLRQRLSQTLGRIEREQLGGVNAPEWTIDHHNMMVEMFACTVEKYMPRAR